MSDKVKGKENTKKYKIIQKRKTEQKYSKQQVHGKGEGQLAREGIEREKM